MSTPTVDQFLSELNQILQASNGQKLKEYLILEPPLPPIYEAVVRELRHFYPANARVRLEQKCQAAIPEYENEQAGGSWPAFITFIVQYFSFIRDVNVQDLVKTHDEIKSLLNQSILALSDSTMGTVILPTVIFYSKVLARLSIGLEKHPELMAQTTSIQQSSSSEDTTERVTLVESSANTIREAFKKCLSERLAPINGGADQHGRPSGRRVGIYECANLCLKLFFHCRKLRSAEQIFGNIFQQSPALARFPAAQRVTFLYYLGRYHFANNHFVRASKALQAAYDQSPSAAAVARQKALILTYLIAANIILGRFPSEQLLSKPACAPMAAHFRRLCAAIRAADFQEWRAMLFQDPANRLVGGLNQFTGANENIYREADSLFVRRRIALQLCNRTEVLMYRTLARRIFLHAGFHGDETKRAPNLDIELIARYLRRKSPLIEAGSTTYGNPWVAERYVDPDFAGLVSFDHAGAAGLHHGPDVAEAEGIVASLVCQGLLHGYVSHRHRKFVIMGARGKRPVDVGFPRVWDVLQKGREHEEVPGWVRDGAGGVKTGGLGAGAGGVVRLTGVKPVGVGA